MSSKESVNELSLSEQKQREHNLEAIDRRNREFAKSTCFGIASSGLLLAGNLLVKDPSIKANVIGAGIVGTAITYIQSKEVEKINREADLKPIHYERETKTEAFRRTY